MTLRQGGLRDSRCDHLRRGLRVSLSGRPIPDERLVVVMLVHEVFVLEVVGLKAAGGGLCSKLFRDPVRAPLELPATAGRRLILSCSPHLSLLLVLLHKLEKVKAIPLVIGEV